MKKLLAIVLVLSMVLAFGASSFASFNADPSELYIMNVFVSGVEYWFPVYAGMKAFCKEVGVSCQYSGCTEYDAQKQVDSFYADLAKNPKGMVISPIEEAAFVEPIAAAAAQGCTVVTYASDSPDSVRCAYVTSDNVNEGQMAAKTLCDAIGDGKSVLVLRNPSQDNHNKRCDAFIAYVEANYPNITIAGDVQTNQDSQKGYEAVMTTYQTDPNLAAVFSPEASSIAGAAVAAAELKETGVDIKCACVDTSDVILDMLADNEMYAVLCPDQFMQGWISMFLCYTNAHPEIAPPMNERRAEGYEGNILSVTVDNGLTVIAPDTAQYYSCAQYAQDIGYKDVDDMLAPYTAG